MAVCSVAHAGTYTADFDSTTLDPSLHFDDGGGKFSESTGLGLLNIAQSKKQAGSDSSAFMGTQFTIDGDFSSRVTINFAALRNTGETGAFAINFSVPFANAYIENVGFDANGDAYESGAFFKDGGYVGGPTISILNPYLDLRLDRVGDTVTEYIARGDTNDWFEVDSVTDASLLGSAQFFLSLGNTQSWPGSAYVTFSDFEITTLPSAAPEPGTWALMFCGVGLAGAALRRRRAALPTAA